MNLQYSHRVTLTHDPNKEVSEDESTYPDPQEYVRTCEDFILYFDDIIINLIPLIQCE